MCHNVHQTLVVEPKLFNWKVDQVASRELYAKWAERAWQESGIASAPCHSPNYSWGFREGFVEYVYAGGNGEPPAAPPRALWKAGWRTRSGKQAADAWFAGYRHGAMVAHEGGFRDQAVLRTSFDSSPFPPAYADEILSPTEAYGDEFLLDEGAPDDLNFESIEPGYPVEMPIQQRSLQPGRSSQSGAE